MPNLDLNTKDDWWNEGFDDYFDRAPFHKTVDSSGMEDGLLSWGAGWQAAQEYCHAMRFGKDWP